MLMRPARGREGACRRGQASKPASTEADLGGFQDTECSEM